MTGICPGCETDNPAARYTDRCFPHRVKDSLPAHYSDCDRFEVYNYGTRQGTCDCTATADLIALLSIVLAAPSDASVSSDVPSSTGTKGDSRP